MMRAPQATKPDPHTCCPNASHLRPRSFGGSWSWVCQFGGMALPVKHCPWCGIELPKRKAPRLEIVPMERGR